VSPVELTDRRGGRRGVGGAKSYDGEKVWSSVNHSIFSAHIPLLVIVTMYITVRYITAKKSFIIAQKDLNLVSGAYIPSFRAG
jgi:hypothetical protein